LAAGSSSTSSFAAKRRTWLITGCSSGLGQALCERVLERGERVVCTARNVAALGDFAARYPDQAIPMALDVTDAAAIKRAVGDTLARTGGIDVLVNNAGYGVVGALEELDEDAVRAAFDANVYGPYRLIRALLPSMRARAMGRIVNVSSMAGFVGTPGFCFYSATKFAVEGMTEALAQEVAAFGIKVILVEPGPFRTAFRGRNLYSAPAMEAYAATVGKFRQMLTDTDGKQPGDPRRGADAMIAAIDADNPPLRLPLGEMCVQQIRNKLERVRRELDTWQEVSLATSFDPGR
jgi:NAD(P)-dependent dehydrogenase (short-subunit alcohol dehydrogenase family)